MVVDHDVLLDGAGEEHAFRSCSLVDRLRFVVEGGAGAPGRRFSDHGGVLAFLKVREDWCDESVVLARAQSIHLISLPLLNDLGWASFVRR